MLAADLASIKLENLHNINLLKASSENVKKLAEAEKKQLRSLVHCILIY
jgi:fructose-1,6-bisphosphatase/sedoheptulose 1,7-bisphosphatase-like protein